MAQTERPIFYNNTIKNVFVIFASLFDNIRILNDYDREIKVPLHFSPQEKFQNYYRERGDFETATNIEMTLPRMGYELTGLSLDSSRMLNPMHRIQSDDRKKFIYTRLPYNFQFSLYIATKKYEESLKIVEQILPFFQPELNVTVNDKVDFDFKTDIPVVLTGISSEIDYEGDFNTRRSTIVWTLDFTVKAYLYGDEKISNIIKRSIIELNQLDFDRKFETIMSEVVPFEANKDEPHVIVDTIINNTV